MRIARPSHGQVPTHLLTRMNPLARMSIKMRLGTPFQGKIAGLMAGLRVVAI